MKAARFGIVALLVALVGAPPLVTAQAGKTAEKGLDWNQFRGPNRDAHSADTGLLQEWPKEGPPLAWKISGLGVGFSSVSVSGTHAFTMGEVDKKATLFALNVADGKVLWKLPFGAAVTDGQGGPGPRSTPATDGTLVFGLGGGGEIVCARVADGKVVWQKSMKEFGAGDGAWHFSESPMLDGNSLVISPGGTVTALAKATGAPMWKSKKIKWDNNTYTSIGIAEIGKVRQYLVMSMNSVAGIMPTTGAVLWEGEFPGKTAVAATPVYGNGIVFAAAGYGVGCKAYNVAIAGAAVQFKEAYTGTQLQIHHGGMVVVGEYVYGCHDGGAVKCIELKTGKEMWADRCVGKGSIAYADGHLLCRGEGGGVAWVDAKPDAFKETGRFTPPSTNGNKCWSHPSISGGKLYLREQDALYCYDLKAK
ncbi:MAG TPA: PQQ-binding-like beta-propeller repeat protein [Planctomycetota bacterium]|nr:PQQ-binding-like beta-propeller repeat protein [Planctomycetota bacterium]